MKPEIFIHHDGAIGDVILSLPALRLIRSDSPLIHLAARADIGSLLEQAGIVEETSRPESPMYLSLYTGCPDINLRNFLDRFSMIFVFTSQKDSIIANSLKALFPNTMAIKTVPPENTNIHISEYRAKQLGDKSCTSIDNYHLKIPPVKLQEAAQKLINAGYSDKTPLISIHPGSGGIGKRWKLEYFLELTESLLEKFKAFVIIFSGHAENDSLKSEIDNFINGRRNIIHISMNELIMVSAFLSLSNIYIGNDSGASHLASLFCRKVIVIFGPTNHILWRPAGDNVIVITSEQKCAPCSPIILSNCPDRKCLHEIPISRIVEEIAVGSIFTENTVNADNN